VTAALLEAMILVPEGWLRYDRPRVASTRPAVLPVAFRDGYPRHPVRPTAFAGDRGGCRASAPIDCEAWDQRRR